MAFALCSVFDAAARAVSTGDVNTLRALLHSAQSQPGISEQSLRWRFGTWVLSHGTATWADLLMQAGLNICTLDLFSCFATMRPNLCLEEIYRWLCTQYAALGGTSSPVARIAQQASLNCLVKHFTFEWLQLTLNGQSDTRENDQHVADALKIMSLAGDLEFLEKLKHARLVDTPTYFHHLKIARAVRVLQSFLNPQGGEMDSFEFLNLSDSALHEALVEALCVLQEAMGVAWPSSVPISSILGILHYGTNTMMTVAGSAGKRLGALTILLSFGRDRPVYTEACLFTLSDDELLRYCDPDIGVAHIVDFARALFKCSQPKASLSDVFARVCSKGAWEVCSRIDLGELAQADLTQDDLNVLLHLTVTSWVSAGSTPKGKGPLSELIRGLLRKGAYPRSPSWFLGHNTVELAMLIGEAGMRELIESNTCCVTSSRGSAHAFTSGSPAPLRCLAARAVSFEKDRIPAEHGDVDIAVSQHSIITLSQFIETHRPLL